MRNFQRIQFWKNLWFLPVFIFVFYFSFSSEKCFAQVVDRDSFAATDSVVQAAGAMLGESLKAIMYKITPLCKNQACMVRAIYMWAAKNVTFRCEDEGKESKFNNAASVVLSERSANSVGYANLVAAMCKFARIPCEVVYGLAKRGEKSIGKVDETKNAHTWNAVEVDGRWFLLDASWASGACAEKNFSKEFTDAWFFTNRQLFALCHFPKLPHFQLLDTPIKKRQFVFAPVVGSIASIFAIVPENASGGVLRGRSDSSVQVTFSLLSPSMAQKINSVSAKVEDSVYKLSWHIESNSLILPIPLPKQGDYPIKLLINNGHAFTFKAHASPALHRKK